MKTLVKNDSMYSLHNVDNFYPTLETNTSILMDKYSDVVINYFHYIHKNISSKNNVLNKFIITRGLDTITHVFLYLLHYTNNSSIALYYCEKASYFYVEFVSQISTDETSFLQLSSRDATNYVYKKTIFEIKHAKQHQEHNSDESAVKMNLIELYLNGYKLFFYKVIHSDLAYNIHITEVSDLIHKINAITIDKHNLSILTRIIDAFYNKIKCIDKFLEIIKNIVKKSTSNVNVLLITQQNVQSNECDTQMVSLPTDKFIKWVTSNKIK